MKRTPSTIRLSANEAKDKLKIARLDGGDIEMSRNGEVFMTLSELESDIMLEWAKSVYEHDKHVTGV